MVPVISIGIDIGQKHDPTAIVVAEATQARIYEEIQFDYRGRAVQDPPPSRLGPTVYTVRDLGRLPLGTPYPEVARKLRALVEALQARGVFSPTIRADATGVGQPVIDLFHEELDRLTSRPRVIAATFTHGDRYTSDRTSASVGKAYLVSRLQTLIQSDRLKLPRTAESEVLQVELQNYEIHVDKDANDQYGAFKVGTHDDLVTALGLAVIEDAKDYACHQFNYITGAGLRGRIGRPATGWEQEY